MKKYAIELKWAITFVIVMLLWMLMEKLLGFHGSRIEQHAIITNFFAIPAITVFVLALRDKRKKFYNGVMTWKQGFLSGFVITFIITVLSPGVQYITSEIISPEYFPNVIEYVVSIEKMTQEEAEAYFNLHSYLVQATIGSFVMGIVTSAVVAIFTRKKSS